MLVGADPRLAHIVADAAPLSDRLSANWIPDEGAESRELAASRLARWRDRAAKGDNALFRRRLEWLGLTLETALSRLGPGTYRELPAWSRIFAAAMQRKSPPLEGADKHPFGCVLAGFAAEAVARLARSCGRAFAPAATASFLDDLLAQLSYLAAPALQLEFVVFRGEAPQAGSERFTAFVDELARGGRWRFFSEYAALARLLSVAVAHWVDHVSTVATDFLADSAAIASKFGVAPGRIEAVRPSLSDPHNRSRSVVAVTCSSGLEVIYKPRPVGVEAAWFALLQHLHGKCGSFRILEVLARGDHGWVEAVRPHDLAEPSDARLFYARAGNLLALMYALEASDCFHENIIADGAFPVLIDMETLMHHVLRPPAELAPAEAAAGDVLFDSVLRAGFLPVWELGRDGICVDISGLGAQRGQTTPYLRRRWSAVNTDRMELHHEPILVEVDDHLPKCGDLRFQPADFVAEVVAGFRETYCGLVHRHDELLRDDGSIGLLGLQTLRLVFHPTRLYSLTLKRLSAPKGLRSGVERSIEVDVIARLYLESGAKLPFRAVLEEERAALERNDIPYFGVRADATTLSLPGGRVIEQAFSETAIARVRSRLARMGPEDLALQSEFIRASLVMSPTTEYGAPIVSTAAAEPGEDDVAVAPRERLIETAVAIAAALEKRAIRTNDAEAIWIAPQLIPGTERRELRAMRMDVYGGIAGVALFLSALWRVTGQGRALALAALTPFRRFIPATDARALFAGGYTIGGATGIGSFIYALTRCAILLDEPGLLHDAAAAAAMLDDALLAQDAEHDLMSGAAGAALGLLALHAATGDSRILEGARACGEHLLTRSVPVGGGIGWRSGRHPPTTGMSHGAAGVALALRRLAAVTGDLRFAQAADAALAFEENMFDAKAGNWRDLRNGEDAPPSFMNTWCHGALGIGLSRAATLDLRDDAFMRRDIGAAVRLNVGPWLSAKDGLCCGNMARTELLLAASRVDVGIGLGAAGAMAERVLRRAEARGDFALTGSPGPDLFDPSMYQGLSGIGYQCLRLAAPQAVPSVLVWQ